VLLTYILWHEVLKAHRLDLESHDTIDLSLPLWVMVLELQAQVIVEVVSVVLKHEGLLHLLQTQVMRIKFDV
jgi:hypothetical protein